LVVLDVVHGGVIELPAQNVVTKLGVDSLLVRVGFHTPLDGSEVFEEVSSFIFEVLLGGVPGVESGGVSNSLSPGEIENGVSLTLVVVPASGERVGGGGVGREEQTVLEGLEGLEPEVGPGGVEEEGLEDGAVEGTSSRELVAVQQVVNGGVGNVPFR